MLFLILLLDTMAVVFHHPIHSVDKAKLISVVTVNYCCLCVCTNMQIYANPHFFRSTITALELVNTIKSLRFKFGLSGLQTSLLSLVH